MSLKVAILVPIYRPEFTQDEQISLNHLIHHLGKFKKIIVQPSNLGLSLKDFDSCEFSPQYFTSVDTYSRLMLSTEFYKAFVEYDYILIYQLDCLVFSSDLQKWCAMGYDYLGAALFEKNVSPPRLSRVGNGGLSLRRVQSFLNVLNSPTVPSFLSLFYASLPDLKIPQWFKRLRVIRDAMRGITWYSQNYSLNEDLFWSDRARLFYPKFKIAPLDVAMRFAFDAYPRTCFEQNGHQMPFGAHAWAKWDRAFWEKHLMKLS